MPTGASAIDCWQLDSNPCPKYHLRLQLNRSAPASTGPGALKSLGCPDRACAPASAGSIIHYGFYNTNSGKRRRYRCRRTIVEAVAGSLQDSKNCEVSIGIKLRLHGYCYFDSELSRFDCVCRRSGVKHARFCHDPIWNGGYLTDPNGLCGGGGAPLC